MRWARLNKQTKEKVRCPWCGKGYIAIMGRNFKCSHCREYVPRIREKGKMVG